MAVFQKTAQAEEDLIDIWLYIAQDNPGAANQLLDTFEEKDQMLETEPEIGRPIDDLPELRELIIPFGDSGYVVIYHHEIKSGSVYVLAFRHQKEAGY